MNRWRHANNRRGSTTPQPAARVSDTGSQLLSGTSARRRPEPRWRRRHPSRPWRPASASSRPSPLCPQVKTLPHPSMIRPTRCCHQEPDAVHFRAGAAAPAPRETEPPPRAAGAASPCSRYWCFKGRSPMAALLVPAGTEAKGTEMETSVSVECPPGEGDEGLVVLCCCRPRRYGSGCCSPDFCDAHSLSPAPPAALA